MNNLLKKDSIIACYYNRIKLYFGRKKDDLFCLNSPKCVAIKRVKILKTSIFVVLHFIETFNAKIKK